MALGPGRQYLEAHLYCVGPTRSKLGNSTVQTPCQESCLLQAKVMAYSTVAKPTGLGVSCGWVKTQFPLLNHPYKDSCGTRCEEHTFRAFEVEADES